MPRFTYRAVAAVAGSAPVEGTLEAPSRAAVVDRLHAQGQIPIRIEEAGGFRLSLPGRRGGVSHKALTLLTGQLATLLNAGLPLDEALAVLRDGARTEAERQALGTLLEKVSGGSSVADAMAGMPATFPDSFVGMVRAGEAGATLAPTLERLAAHMQRVQETREHIRSALTYPAVVAATCLLSLVVLFVMVVPRFEPLFRQAGAALPTSAAFLLGFSRFMAEWWWLLVLAPALALLAFQRHLRAPAARLRWERRLFAAPVIGPVARQVQAAGLCRTLGTLLRNGVSLLGALSLTRAATRSSVFTQALDRVLEQVKAGKGLAEPMRQSGAFPPVVLRLVRVGEETGRQDEMLLKAAELMEAESRRAIDRALGLLTPAVTIILGLVVAAVILTILTAMLSVYDITL